MRGEELIWARGDLRVKGNFRAGLDLPVRAEECPGALAMRGPSARKIPGGMQSVGAGRDLSCNFTVGQIFLNARRDLSCNVAVGQIFLNARRDLPCKFAVRQISPDAGLWFLRFMAVFGGRSLRSRI